jgi:sugar lactone lactonase YvrE
LADLVDPQAHFEKIAYGFRYVEGPVWDPRGWLLFSDIPANTVYQCAATDLDIALARGLASRTRQKDM